MNAGGNGRIAVVGMFDGLHAGHRFLLEQLQSEGVDRGLHPLAVTFANHPLEIIAPGRAPLLLSTPDEKSSLFAGTGVEAEIIPFDDSLRLTSASDFLHMLARRYNVQAMMLGFNNRFGHDAPRDFDTYRRLALSHGIELLQAPELTIGDRHISSSAIRVLLACEGDAGTAATMLTRPYSLAGIVAGGRQIGRTIGFPTANRSPRARDPEKSGALRKRRIAEFPPDLGDARKLIPKTGVYAAVATCRNGMAYPSVVNIGHRPTVEKSAAAPLSVEAHLIGFDGDLYGQQLGLGFIARIRPEQRFPDLEALRCQIEDDVNTAVGLCLT